MPNTDIADNQNITQLVTDIYASPEAEESRFSYEFRTAEWWKNIGDHIVDIYNNSSSTVMNWLGSASDWFTGIGDDLKSFFTDIGTSSTSVYEELKSYIESSQSVSSSASITNGSSPNSSSSSSINSIYYSSSKEGMVNDIISNADSILSGMEDWVGGFFDGVESVTSDILDSIENFANTLGSTNSTVIQTLGVLVNTINDAAKTYEDGVSETSFGAEQEVSWQGNTYSFLQTFKRASNTYRVKFSSSTPLDAGSNSANLYGSMILGVPPTFTNITDPANRTYIQTFLQDAKFITITPGLPKYNGTTYDTGNKRNQTNDGNSALEYLLRNGLDAEFANKDKRYYSFQAKYEEYFAYLETMLNTIWIKMGLATESDNTFDLFTFFKLRNKNNQIDPSGFNQLLAQYNNSLGFFVNPSGTLSESVDSSPTSFGNDLAGSVNSSSDEFQHVNYLHGMGTGGAYKNAISAVGKTATIGKNMRNLLSSNLENAQTMSSKVSNVIAKTALFAVGAALDAAKFTYGNDLGAVIQQFNTTNGMKVTYPELWSESQFTRSVSVNFEFISPYGDPLSIFKYVMVPFAALLCFAMPRQAAENGLVSPFLIRADLSGMFTVDLGLMTSFTFTRG